MLAVAEHENIVSDLIPRIATGFCSGMARTGGMCGAVTGGIMAIGLALGRKEQTDDIDRCYHVVMGFLTQFDEQFESLSCLELTGVHLGTPEGQVSFRETGQVQRCTDYVGEAARMVVKFLDKYSC